MRMNKLSLFVAALLLSACGTLPTPKTPDQIVYDAHAVYASALVLEIQYAKLPRCGENAPELCSDKATVGRVKGVSNATNTALISAQKTVTTPGFGDDALQSAADAAMNAATAFSDITKQLKVK